MTALRNLAKEKMSATDRPDCGYRYIPGPFQCSAGVAALPGYRLERIRFLDPVPLGQGFTRIERYMDGRVGP